MKCRNCLLDLYENEKAYKCEKCGLTIWKAVSGHKLTLEEVKQLLEKGETEFITFIGRNTHKPYKAKLKIQGSKVGYEYGNANGSIRSKLQSATIADTKINPEAIRIRVESQQPGASILTIQSDMLSYNINITFGLVSTRECECLSLVAAADYIKYHQADYKEKSLYIEVNSQEVANYLLKETNPRDRLMKFTVAYTWDKLSGFKSYDIVYKKRKRTKLAGTNVSRYYPKGLFPSLKKLVTQEAGSIFIYLPANPAVCKQFTASFPRAVTINIADSEDDEENLNELVAYTLQPDLINKVETWFNIVTSKSR